MGFAPAFGVRPENQLGRRVVYWIESAKRRPKRSSVSAFRDLLYSAIPVTVKTPQTLLALDDIDISSPYGQTRKGQA